VELNLILNRLRANERAKAGAPTLMRLAKISLREFDCFLMLQKAEERARGLCLIMHFMLSYDGALSLLKTRSSSSFGFSGDQMCAASCKNKFNLFVYNLQIKNEIF
jgi:hypothetical protein